MFISRCPDVLILLMQDLVKVHKSLMVEVQDSILNKNALNLYQIFISYKERYSWASFIYIYDWVPGEVLLLC